MIDPQGVYERLGEIKTPMLVIDGEENIATPPDKARRMHEKIPGSRLVTIPAAGHSSTIERPEAVNQALLAFLQG